MPPRRPATSRGPLGTYVGVHRSLRGDSLEGIGLKFQGFGFVRMEGGKCRA
jgi:hypothetical protein